MNIQTKQEFEQYLSVWHTDVTTVMSWAVDEKNETMKCFYKSLTLKLLKLFFLEIREYGTKFYDDTKMSPELLHMEEIFRAEMNSAGSFTTT